MIRGGIGEVLKIKDCFEELKNRNWKYSSPFFLSNQFLNLIAIKAIVINSLDI